MAQLNGNRLNDSNGNGKHHTEITTESPVLTSLDKVSQQPSINQKFDNFDQSVVLRQSPVWSRTIMLTFIALACFGIVWACVAKIEQVVPATGQLKPQGTVKDVQAPVNGVVKEVYVKDGQTVNKGDLLLTFETV